MLCISCNVLYLPETTNYGHLKIDNVKGCYWKDTKEGLRLKYPTDKGTNKLEEHIFPLE